MEGFVERLQELIGRESQSGFARRCGIGQTSLRQYLAGGTPGLDKVILIAQATKSNLNWLATGEGFRDSTTETHGIDTQPHKLGGGSVLQLVDQDKFEDDAFVLLPRFEIEASAGTGLIPSDEEIRDFLAFKAEFLREAGIDPRQAQVIKVRGRSMMPTFVDGEWVVIDRAKTRVETGDVYAVVYQEGLRIKRLRKERDAKGKDVYVLISDNAGEGYPEERVEGPDLDDFRVVGRVDRHLRSL